MRVIVSGGGTGGHIYPAIAIADKVMAMDENSQVLYIGNDIGLEKDLVPRTGYEIRFVTAKWFDRRNPLVAFSTAFDVWKGTREALKIMKEFKPDVVIGTGGFVCVPVVLAGKKYGAKTFIHEQNAFPGMANRFLERFVDKIFLGFQDASQYFKEPAKHVYAGNPVRRCFFEADGKECRKELGLKADDFIVFVFGGSQGAETINNVCFGLMEAINGAKGATMIFGTGEMYYEEILALIAEKNIDLQENIIIKDYMNDIEKYMASSDLIIGRSGALSVSEATACGKASIFIPSPNVTGNHQYYNAKVVADRGGAVIIEEKDFTSEGLIREVFKIKNDADLQRRMSKASRSCAPDKATDIIYSYFK